MKRGLCRFADEKMTANNWSIYGPVAVAIVWLCDCSNVVYSNVVATLCDSLAIVHLLSDFNRKPWHVRQRALD